MIKYKYVWFGTVMRHFVYIPVKYANHQQKEVGPKMTKPVNEVSAPDLTKK